MQATDATDERVMSRVHQMGVYPLVNRVSGFKPFPRFRLFLGQSEKTGALEFITTVEDRAVRGKRDNFVIFPSFELKLVVNCISFVAPSKSMGGIAKLAQG